MPLSKQHQGYQSEFTLFLADLKAKNPLIEAGQLAGRALLWDKAPISLTDASRLLDARAPSAIKAPGRPPGAP